MGYSLALGAPAWCAFASLGLTIAALCISPILSMTNRDAAD